MTAADAAAFDHFGNSVAISGDTAVIGAMLDDDGGVSDRGSVYVFRRSGTSWSREQKLTAPDASRGDNFGSSVAISGNTVIVGAWDDDDGGINSVSAYVFRRSGTTWSSEQKLTAADADGGDFFGSSVAIGDDVVIIGARGDEDGGVGSGSAYVFQRSGTAWSQEQKLVAPDGDRDRWFGNSVAISDDTFVIGTSSGSAYVFRHSGTALSQEQKLTAPDTVAGENFGNSVAINGDTVVVGAWQEGDTGIGRRGAAYIFRRNGTTWSQEQKLIASDAASFDQFGSSVTISGDTVIVGAWEDDDGGNGSGSAYVFGAR